MAGMTYIDMSRFTSNPAGFYATNNQFQKSGPKGFMEVKALESGDLYVRVDLPGVPDDAIRYRVDAVRQKVVFFSGETLSDGNYVNNGVREYSGTTGLGCDCCEITGVDAKMKDGVLRMIVSKVKVKDHENKCDLTLPPPLTGKSGRIVEDHPFVVRGRKGAIFAEPKDDGGLYIAVDLPGASEGDAVLIPQEYQVEFRGEGKNVSEHDESGRLYVGRFGNTPEFAPSLLRHTVSGSIEFGVLKIHLNPPPSRNNEE
ncbi:unnamed protein product [Microthlaspi erraticum]|uniref:SHSP domain-containing protein n=1 Tax=Microthlaspi erraticum TaxID=1685480 RepID=A0A6D2IG17_9BRAS|nr:unnamed protein product [Microthlaspi erraticum]